MSDLFFRKTLLAFFAALLAVLPSVMAAKTAAAADHAVVIMYHRFGEPRYPSTNTTLDQFEAHLKEIAEGGYTVMPLIDIVRAIENGTQLPDRTIAITVDDAFLSVYENAFPRLKEYGFPFTLFVATSYIERGLRGYASWDQLREMQAAGVDIGSQSHTHPHLHRLEEEAVRGEIEKSNAIFLRELGITPALHAYPFGEYSPRTRAIMEEMGFEAAFGQHSGVMHKSINAFEYPRFTFNENYGSLDRLRLSINALPIPASNITPDSAVLEEGGNPPVMGFNVAEGIEPLDRIECYANEGMGKVKKIILKRRIEVRPPKAFTGEHGRINCTMPYYDGGSFTGRYRWFGRQFIQP